MFNIAYNVIKPALTTQLQSITLSNRRARNINCRIFTEQNNSNWNRRMA